MINEIVVLVPGQSFDTAQIEKVMWSEFDKSVGDMHGKRKKGAPKVKSDAPICEVHFKNGIIWELKSPVGGQLIELNENLLTNHGILGRNGPYNGERYVAIIYPTTKLPGPQDTDVEVWKQKQHEASLVPKICYSYLEGTCTRGESCRFQHDDTSSIVESKVDVT